MSVDLDRAHDLHRRILDLGDAGRYDDLLGLADDPSTSELLGLLSDTARMRAELILREARRWEEGRRRSNRRRLAEARKALEGLDLDLAAGLLQRVEGRFLDEEGKAERDRLLLEVSARSMEVESLRDVSERLIAESRPRPRRWWRRRR